MAKEIYEVLKRPILTEKSLTQKDKENKYSFEVAPNANKAEIRQAVEKLFKVNVTKITTVSMKGKLHRVGRFEGKRPDWKKAVVTLKDGQKIEVSDAA
ncbi:MAG: 50S ribosomal protein L23 [Elusimicrobiaceae bacterium]|nr:50S ribosomal protein L23 [Elusimicrobiaceae bacterium]